MSNLAPIELKLLAMANDRPLLVNELVKTFNRKLKKDMRPSALATATVCKAFVDRGYWDMEETKWGKMVYITESGRNVIAEKYILEHP